MENSSKKYILVVDDTETNIDILVEIFGDEYDVSVAMDGESAIEDVHANPPDLILLDIMMPGIDGYEVCKRLKDDENTKNIPIIFITALSEVQDEAKGLKLGAVDYVTKPINPLIVKARVENHLELQQARKDLERQNHILQENIYLREEMDRISRHDLKTPLNSIISIPRILLQESRRLEPDQIELIEMVEKSGHTMLNMVNLSLDLFKMEKGTYKLKPVCLDILSVIKKIIFDLRSISESKSIQFNLKIDGQPASDNDLFGVSGEELLCYSMFANLIKNAVEASPDSGTVTILLSNLSDLSHDNSQDNSCDAQITIHNHGVVPESIRENFFEKYSTAEKKGGTGLGTYSAKLMAQTLGGEILMSTSQENGTAIRVKLKHAKESELTGLSTTKSEILGADSSLSLIDCPLKIMVVDDDEYNRLILKRYLNYPKFTVELADNGESAFNKFKEKHFDIVFMDMEMPVMDGIDAVILMREWEIKQTKDKKRSVVVALSGHNDTNTCQNCLDLGFDEYLSKPVNSKILFKTILSFFSSSKNQDRVVEIDADLEDLIPSFLNDKKAEIELICKMLSNSVLPDSNSYESIKHLGHKLKGGFNMYGFKAQGEIASKIEDAANNYNLIEIKCNVEMLKESLKDITIRYISMD